MKTEILPAAKAPPTLNRAFELLAEQLKKHGQSAQRRVMAHIRAKTSKSLPLPLLHKDPEFDEAFKMALYTECARAVVTGNYEQLDGDVGQGDKLVPPAPPEPLIPVVETNRATQPPATGAEPPLIPQQDRTVTTTRLPEPVVPVKRAVLDTSKLDPISAAVLATLRPHIEQLVDDRIAHGMSNGAFPVDRVKQIVSAMLPAAAPAPAPALSLELVSALQRLAVAINNIVGTAEDLHHPLHALKPALKPATET